MVEYGARAVALVDVDQVVRGFGELEEAVAELALLLRRGVLDDPDEVPDDVEIGGRRVAGHPHQLAVRAEGFLRGRLEEPVGRDDQGVRSLRNRFVSEHGLEVVAFPDEDRAVFGVRGFLHDLQLVLEFAVRDEAEDTPLRRTELAVSSRIDLDPRHIQLFLSSTISRSIRFIANIRQDEARNTSSKYGLNRKSAERKTEAMIP